MSDICAEGLELSAFGVFGKCYISIIKNLYFIYVLYNYISVCVVAF